MAAIIWADVVSHAAQLLTVDSTAQTDILAHVNTALAVAVFGGETHARTRLARVYLAAHFGQTITDAAGGTAGRVSDCRPKQSCRRAEIPCRKQGERRCADDRVRAAVQSVDHG